MDKISLAVGQSSVNESMSDDIKSPHLDVGNHAEGQAGSSSAVDGSIDDIKDQLPLYLSPDPPMDASGGFDLSLLDMSSADNPEDAGFLGDPLLCHNMDTSGGKHNKQMMVFQGSINGHQAVILLDSGANTNFVSKQFAERTGITQRLLTEPTPVKGPMGKIYSATTQLMSVDLRVVGKAVKTSLVVVPLAAYDVILGTPWFRLTNPKFDWVLWTCNGRSVYSRGGISYGHPGRNSRRLQSVTVEQKYEPVMRELLRKYSSVFATTLPKRTFNKDAAVHSFLMKEGALPIRDGERRKSPEENRLAREMLKEGEATGRIEESKSEWCSQLLMVVKKDKDGRPTGKPRFCVDYRRVNALMRKDSHPLPLPESMFAQLNGATVFSKLDLTKGFYQIALAPECREYLAFSTPDGLRQWTVMPFGIANAPATFQREMQRMLRERLDISVMVYIDDILIFSKNEADHAEHVEWVLAQLKKNNYYANPDKCEFFQPQVNFLGHIIKAGGLAVQQHKIDSIVSWPTPACVKDVRSFLGLTGYYRRFVNGYAAITAPLSDLTHKDTPFVWGDKEEAVFTLLKKLLSSAPTLSTPDHSKPFLLHTDASGYAIGACLSQIDDKGRCQPVAFMSKKMNLAQRNYAVHEWELLAVIEALKAWRCYLYGSSHPIKVYTDHSSLQYISTQPNLSARQCRWVEIMQDYTFQISHIKGEMNVVADALSRRSDYELMHQQENETRLRAGLNGDATADIRPRLQLEVASITTKPDIAAVSSLVAPSLLADIRALAVTDSSYQDLIVRHLHYGLIVKDGLVYSPAGLLYIPAGNDLRTILLREVHDAPTGGHLGREKTYSRLTAEVYWKGIHNDVRDYVTSCVSCARNKAMNRSTAGMMQPLPIPARRWETITMDFVGPLPMTRNQHDFLIVVVDKFSKMVHLIPTHKKVRAPEVAQLVFDNVIRIHGFPDYIVSDRDRKFTSIFWRALWKLTGTTLKHSTSYHPQTDGQTENVNRAVQDIMRSYVDDERSDWDRHLTAVEIAINSSRHASTGYTPHFLNHNQEMRLPFGIALKEAVSTALVPAAVAVMSEMAEHDETARTRLIEAQEKQKVYADQHRRVDVFAVNDQVMLSTDKMNGYGKKLLCRYIGPFAITAVDGNTVVLALPDHLTFFERVSIDRVKRYVPSVGEWPGRVQNDQSLPVLDAEDSNEQFEVEAILGKKEELESDGIKKRKVNVIRYLVAWVGYPAEDHKWVRATDLDNASDLVADWERKQIADTTGKAASVMLLYLD
jgi:RNase H-like domain found in reverse transcriptase/Reverse transcriptase (RNA-dependent DNA polymerase)/Integrase zinc binding domain/Retroviral aspartyl protease